MSNLVKYKEYPDICIDGSALEVVYTLPVDWEEVTDLMDSAIRGCNTRSDIDGYVKKLLDLIKLRVI